MVLGTLNPKLRDSHNIFLHVSLRHLLLQPGISRRHLCDISQLFLGLLMAAACGLIKAQTMYIECLHGIDFETNWNLVHRDPNFPSQHGGL